MERELVQPVRLCRSDGALDPDAVGWSRRPLHDCYLGEPRGRRKRWHHWAVLDRDRYLTLTCADVDLAAVGVVMLVDLESGRRTFRFGIARGGRSEGWPSTPGHGQARFAGQGLRLEFTDGPTATRLSARAFGLSADIQVARADESLNVVVPRDGDSYLYTSKQIGLAAEGEIRWWGQTRRLKEGAFAGLDYARGRWPLKVAWHWAAGAGTAGGRPASINLGAGWTDRSGVTENALIVGGRLHKLHDDVQFTREPRAPGSALQDWRIRGPRVDLLFSARQRLDLGANLGFIGASLDHGIGAFRGHLFSDQGERLEVAMGGWCEQVSST
jgi:hypothetical protein